MIISRFRILNLGLISQRIVTIYGDEKNRERNILKQRQKNKQKNRDKRLTIYGHKKNRE